ncbi:9348_t:CDS:1, partial [Gigaspora margarita]
SSFTAVSVEELRSTIMEVLNKMCACDNLEIENASEATNDEFLIIVKKFFEVW